MRKLLTIILIVAIMLVYYTSTQTTLNTKVNAKVKAKVLSAACYAEDRKIICIYQLELLDGTEQKCTLTLIDKEFLILGNTVNISSKIRHKLCTMDN